MNGLMNIAREVPAQAPRSGTGTGRTRTLSLSKGPASGESRSSDGRLPLTGEAEAVRHEA